MGFSILSFSIYFTVYVYVITVMFFIIFIYMLDFQNQLNNSIKLNMIDSYLPIKINFFLFLGSLIGIPPLMGFFSKLILFVTLMVFQKFLIIVILLLVNLFLLIFYLQQTRYIQTNKKKTYFFKINIEQNYNLYFIIITFQAINILSIFIIPFIFDYFVISSL